MRKISCLHPLASVCSPSTWRQLQESPRPAVQVIVGADGKVKVIDPKTGKDVPSVVVRVKQISPDTENPMDQAKLRLEHLLKQLNGKPIQLHFNGKPGEGVIVLQTAPTKPAPPATLDQKVDRLLAEMAELRKDVNQLKSKIDGKKPQMFFELDFAPPKPPAAPAKKPANLEFEFKAKFKPGETKEVVDEAIRKALDFLKKKMEDDAKPERKKAGDNRKPAERPADRSAELDRRIQELIREVEELRSEIRKTKTPKSRRAICKRGA